MMRSNIGVIKEVMIRHSENGKMYLYDIINKKKKRAPRLSHKAVR